MVEKIRQISTAKTGPGLLLVYAFSMHLAGAKSTF
jgi:hypothetical protein